MSLPYLISGLMILLYLFLSRLFGLLHQDIRCRPRVLSFLSFLRLLCSGFFPDSTIYGLRLLFHFQLYLIYFLCLPLLLSGCIFRVRRLYQGFCLYLLFHALRFFHSYTSQALLYLRQVYYSLYSGRLRPLRFLSVHLLRSSG